MIEWLGWAAGVQPGSAYYTHKLYSGIHSPPHSILWGKQIFSFSDGNMEG